MKKKTVDIFVKSPVLTSYIPVKNTAYGIEMNIIDIKLNIVRGNTIIEILPDGTRVPLTMMNYDKDNSRLMKNPDDMDLVKPEENKASMEDTLKAVEVEKEPVEDDDVNEEVDEKESIDNKEEVEPKKTTKKKSNKK